MMEFLQMAVLLIDAKKRIFDALNEDCCWRYDYNIKINVTVEDNIDFFS